MLNPELSPTTCCLSPATHKHAGFNLRQGPSPADFPDHSPDIAALMARSAIVRCNSSSRLGELTSLTRLDLDGCAVPDDLAALAQLTDLRHLTVSVMTHDPAGVPRRMGPVCASLDNNTMPALPAHLWAVVHDGAA